MMETREGIGVAHALGAISCNNAAQCVMEGSEAGWFSVMHLSIPQPHTEGVQHCRISAHHAQKGR